MISVIETAIITIIISFISGLLLEYYKNLAPKILCNIGEGVQLELNNKKICAYVLNIRNISNKTIHKLTLNIQGLQNDLKIGDAQITKGLKFDSSIEDNILDVYIPFLSKNDEFSATLYVESKYGEYKKPVVTIRSPEDFKEIESIEQGGIISSLFNMPKNINKLLCNIMKTDKDSTSNRGRRSTVNKGQSTKKIASKENSKIFGGGKNSGTNRKALIAIISIILIISIGALGVLYFQEMSTNAKTSDEKTEVQKQSTSGLQSEGEQTKNANEKPLTSGKNKNPGVKVSGSGTNKDSGAKTSQNGDAGNTDTKAQAGGVPENSDIKTSTDGNSQSNTDIKAATSATNGSTNLKPPAVTATENTDAKSSTGGTNGNTDQKTSTDGTTKNVDTKPSTGGATASSGN